MEPPSRDQMNLACKGVAFFSKCSPHFSSWYLILYYFQTPISVMGALLILKWMSIEDKTKRILLKGLLTLQVSFPSSCYSRMCKIVTTCTCKSSAKMPYDRIQISPFTCWCADSWRKLQGDRVWRGGQSCEMSNFFRDSWSASITFLL